MKILQKSALYQMIRYSNLIVDTYLFNKKHISHSFFNIVYLKRQILVRTQNIMFRPLHWLMMWI